MRYAHVHTFYFFFLFIPHKYDQLYILIVLCPLQIHLYIYNLFRTKLHNITNLIARLTRTNHFSPFLWPKYK